MKTPAYGQHRGIIIKEIHVCTYTKYGAMATKLNCWFTAGIETPDLPVWHCRAVGFVFGSFKIHALSFIWFVQRAVFFADQQTSKVQCRSCGSYPTG